MAPKIQDNKDILSIVKNCEYLQGSKLFEKWLKRAKYAPKTSIGYSQGIRSYCEFHKMSPEELLGSHENEIKNGVLPADYELYDQFYDFVEYLQGTDKSDNTIAFYLSGVKSLYRSRNIVIPKPINSRSIKNTLSKNDYVKFTKKEIRQCLQLVNPRNKAIILTLISTGIGKDDLLDLPLSIMDNEPDPSDGVMPLTVIRKKTGVKYQTFINREAYDAITDYLKFRQERLRINQENHPEADMKDDCPYLFVSMYGQKFQKLTGPAYNKIFRDMNNKMGAEYRGEKGQYMRIRGHGFRHFFKSEMQLVGNCPEWAVEHFMGHRLTGTDKSYLELEGDPTSLRKIYSKAMHAININREIQQVYSTEDSALMRGLEEENRKLKENVAKIGKKMAYMEMSEEAIFDRMMKKFPALAEMATGAD